MKVMKLKGVMQTALLSDENVKILQIIPAQGWYAAFLERPEEDGDIFYRPLAGFALVENDDGTRWVAGIVSLEGDLFDLAENCLAFVAYIHESDPNFDRSKIKSPEIKFLAKDTAQSWKKLRETYRRKEERIDE